MNRLEFMQKLESLLNDISQSERTEALQYYNDYLNDAGVENEQEVLDSLGTPEKLAKTIREGLNENGTFGEFTETGYKNYAEEDVKNEVAEKTRRKQMSGGMIALIVILCVLASPLLISLAAAIFSGAAGIALGIIGLLVGVAAAGIVLLIVAIVLIGIGVGALFSVPLAGLCLIGAGILAVGLALFFIWFTVWICGKAVPWMIKGVVSIGSNLFHGKRGERA